MRILLIEDDQGLAKFIAKGLSEQGFIVETMHNGEDGLHFLLVERFDAVILDIMLPGIDGFKIIEEARKQGCDVPILVLSARGELEDRVKGLQLGSDDYMVKPFSIIELQTRVHALIRRSTKSAETTNLQIADLILDLLKHEVRRGESLIELQPREFKLLEFMLRNQGRVVTKTMILENIWNYEFDPQTNVVDVLVSRLRKKIDKDYSLKLIHTIRGVGYALKIS